MIQLMCNSCNSSYCVFDVLGLKSVKTKTKTKNMRNANEFNPCPANLLGSRLVDIGPEVLEDGKQEVEGALLSGHHQLDNQQREPT